VRFAKEGVSRRVRERAGLKLGCPTRSNTARGVPEGAKLSSGAIIGPSAETHVPTGAGVSPRPEGCRRHGQKQPGAHASARDGARIVTCRGEASYSTKKATTNEPLKVSYGCLFNRVWHLKPQSAVPSLRNHFAFTSARPRRRCESSAVRR